MSNCNLRTSLLKQMSLKTTKAAGAGSRATDSAGSKLPSNRNRHRYFALAVMAILMGLLISWPASLAAYTIEKHDDQVTNQYVISPTKVELEVKPGDNVSRDLIVANRTGQTIAINFTIEDFEGSRDPAESTIFLGEETSTWGAKDWLDPEISSIVLKHGETMTFRVKVSVPRNAEPGGHYAVVFATSTAETIDEQGSRLDITSRVGSLFLIRVAGNVREEGFLSGLETPSFLEYGPVDFGLIFNNEGNVHLKPSGRILVSNMLGQSSAEIPVREWVVLPESARRNTVQWDARYLFGRYTAKAEIYYGPNEEKLTLTKTFWVIPWKLLLGALVIIIVIILLVIMTVRKKKRSREELEDELDRLRTGAQEKAAAPAETGAGAAEPAVDEASSKSRHVALDELFPSMSDDRVVDLNDHDTIRLVRSLIDCGIDLARAYIDEGKVEEARYELMEAKSAAQHIGLLADVGIIDNMLRSLD